MADIYVLWPLQPLPRPPRQLPHRSINGSGRPPASRPLWRFCSPGLLLGRRCCGGGVKNAVLLSLDKRASKRRWLPLRFVCASYLPLVSTCISLGVLSKKRPPVSFPRCVRIVPFVARPLSPYMTLAMRKASDWWRFACFQYLSPSFAFAAAPHCSLAYRRDGSLAVKAEGQNLAAELH